MVRFIPGCIPLVVSALLLVDGGSARGDDSLDLVSSQSDLLRVEPILVTLRLDSERVESLPAGPGKTDAGELRFEIEPAVKMRAGARPLPLEAQASAMNAKSRDYDLLEWYQFPGEGKFTVRAVLEQEGVKLASKPITFSIRSPGKDDVELPPVARIHHPPWCNYGTNKFCGDTFDLANRWPDSRLAKYCHYWNGRFLQHNKEYEKAIESYEMVIKQGPKFALSDDADFGIVECLTALGKPDEAQKHNAALLEKYDRKIGPTAILRLAQGTKTSS
jgi:tetratricopeptide (TPR) repeat protein